MNPEPAISAIEGEIFTITRQLNTVNEELSKLYGEINQKNIAVKYRTDRAKVMKEKLDSLASAKRMLEAMSPVEDNE